MPRIAASVALAVLAAHGASAQSLRPVAASRAVSGTAATSGCTPGDNTFDNLLLVEQWPGTMGVSAPGFTMHGLWPSRTGANVANYPCQCTNQAFDPSALSSIMTQMNEFWPSAEGDNPTFWSHEFEKHGTCAESIAALETELKFFSGALGLRKAQNSIGLLASAGIKPSSSTTYKVADVAAAFPHVTVLKCNSNNQLQEVATCFDKSLNAMDCENDAYGGTSCADGISIPPVGSSPSPSASPSPSTPSGSTCVPDKHGPPCSSDADCAGITNCVRCAKSGYCTTEPAEEEEDDEAEEEERSGAVAVRMSLSALE